MNGVLVIDKPAGMTSHDVVNRVRRLLRERSVGHLGTLDPMATGVLPLVLGKLTRLAQFYTASDKEYEGEIRFGFATDTYDAEGQPTTPPCDAAPSLAAVRELAGRFRGVIRQVPPPFSAKKIAGVPAYKLARKKQEVKLQPVEVEIKEFEIFDVEGDRARFHAQVASGTYIRSVAHEMGELLGTGAHLVSLRRTRVAEFAIADAHTLEQVEAAASLLGENSHSHDQSNAPETWSTPHAREEIFFHLRRVLPEFPAVAATEQSAALIRAGRPVNLPEMSRARKVKVFLGQNELICIADRVAGTLFHPKVVLAG